MFVAFTEKEDGPTAIVPAKRVTGTDVKGLICRSNKMGLFKMCNCSR